MAACILCSKSAGFFYALHKNCYQRYQAVINHLVELLQDQLADQSLHTLSTHMRAQVDALAFTPEASQRCYVKALEQYAGLATQPLKQVTLSERWLALISMLAVDEDLFVDPHLVKRQRNLPALRSLQAGQLPQCVHTRQSCPASLAPQEQVWWCFKQAHLAQKKPQQKDWSIVSQLIDNLRPRHANLVTQSVAQGALWLTNLAAYIETEQDLVRIDYADIYSCTPASGGVSLQLKHSATLAQSLVCEDGRLLYQFLLMALKRT